LALFAMSDFRPPRRRLLTRGSPEEKSADSELVRGMQVGEESALEVLYARYGGLIFTLALRIVGDPELAREVLQDTFLRCWDGREAYDPQRGRVPGWLMGIARNRAIDLLRSRPHQARLREREPLVGLASEPVQPDATDSIMLRRAVVNALQALPIGQRQAIELAYYGGHTQVEIARELGEPLGTIKSRTRQAMELLRTALWPLIEPNREA
jgi:RNA polymerase sigma-70 factor (ECF subfamily)